MVVLGISAEQIDVSAAVLVDGDVVAAIEEERITRVKHASGFPAGAIRRCLEVAGLRGDDVDLVAFGGNPRANLLARSLHTLRHRPSPRHVAARLRRAFARPAGGKQLLAEALGKSPDRLPPITRIEHHEAHLASAFLVSPFDDAAVCSMDGFGDFVSAATAVGRGSRLAFLDKVTFPHSLGVFYTAVTQYLGFPNHGDEYKVMGLAAYGRPSFRPTLERLVHLRPGGRFALDPGWFADWMGGGRDRGDAAPTAGARPPLYGPALVDALGPPRVPGDALTSRHEDIAASAQAVFERAAAHVLAELARRTGMPAVCVAGGCFMNSVLNGKITQLTPFRRLYVQPAAGDAGLALGAACLGWHRATGAPRRHVMDHAYLGPAYGPEEVGAALAALDAARVTIDAAPDDAALCRRVAAMLAAGQVVGWHQGRMEWGSRALGSRSVLADPRRPEMRDRINATVKRREPFRPLAPSVLEEQAAEWFEAIAPDPFMTQVRPVRPERRALVPAITHVDGSSRPHVVARRANPLYHRLITEFATLTGVPMLLNTSFNQDEPIVDTPAQAVACFLRNAFDALVIGRHVVERRRA